jgi:hypothetical protein
MLIKRGCNPGMRQLQQRSPARAEKQGRFAIDLPTDGIWAEDACQRIGRVFCDRIPKAPDLLAASFHTLFRLTGSAWRQ